MIRGSTQLPEDKGTMARSAAQATANEHWASRHIGLSERAIRLLREARWIVLCFLAIFLFLILLSYNPVDPGWSHAVTTRQVHNLGGRIGAWFADLILYLFGLSAYLFSFFLMLRVLASYRRLHQEAHLARTLPLADAPDALPPARFAWERWIGFILLLVGCSALEGSRLYNLNADLPLAPGGLLGALVSGPVHIMLGAVGGTLALLLLIAIGFSLATGVSWMSIFERTGAVLEGSVDYIRQKLAARADRQAGARAARQRGTLLGRAPMDLDGDESGAPLIRPARLTQGSTASADEPDEDDIYLDDDTLPAQGRRVGCSSRDASYTAHAGSPDDQVGSTAAASSARGAFLDRAGLAEGTSSSVMDDLVPGRAQGGQGTATSGHKGDANGGTPGSNNPANAADAEETPTRGGLFGGLLSRVAGAAKDAVSGGWEGIADRHGAVEPIIAGFGEPGLDDDPDMPVSRSATGGAAAWHEPHPAPSGCASEDAAQPVGASHAATGDISHGGTPHGNAYVGQTVGVQREPVRESTTISKPQPAPVYCHQGENSPLPDLALLDAPPATVETMSPETLEYTSRLIEKKLSDFGISATVVHAYPGPVITRYEIEPATGVKGSQIVNLAKDLARSLSVISLRVVETIPGKNLMGLELPNPRRQGVRLSEIIGSRAYVDAKSPVTVSLGKDIAGNPVVADLAKMPHLLVAGTTGSGKSVGINAMLMSILYKADPSQVRMILIDPKMLEMSVYEGIPHLLAPVVTDMRQAGHALNWCVGEMERRYKLMSKLGVRNLAGYNAKIADAEKREELIPNPFSLTPDAPEPLSKLPIIVVVIDELADLMMVVGKKIEELIARLAQKARAAGIHLVLATQRPSVDVITGLIKANIPSRIAFQVSSKIDSRTILDQMGAETLLGQGDMLYLPAGTNLPQRVHGAYVADDEVHKVVTSWREVGGEPDYIEGILEGGVPEETNTGSAVGFGGLSSTLAEAGMDGESDAMYDQAVAIVLQHRRASISLVQRHLRIGYNRAARLLEQMERSGIVSPMTSNGNRDILVPASAKGRGEGEG